MDYQIEDYLDDVEGYPETIWEDEEDDDRRYMGSDSDFSDHALGIDY